ncbi:MAG: bud emergence protein 1 [Chrysothrix sp. TS-e1954]|nr:MAG: bud emergence protein 1 [Chrysothrix sp. TS-e1954]
MKVFRRSGATKSSADKGDSRTHHISIPAKDAVAIVPPKKVIKALHDYRVQDPQNNPNYLSFSQGDFLHVVAREDDPDWYEACNPMKNTRGLVPVSFFELVGKSVKDNVSRVSHGRSNSFQQQHDSGYAERSPRNSGQGQYTQPSQPMAHPLGAGQKPPRSMVRSSGALVYGIVQYDFKAERPDELEAKAGEAIIVIAQSNPEWFVAKPITRLGGPGLIPVSFIEIRDMATGNAVSDTQDAVARAGVPKVEEWKKMAATYKNSSIPLGQLSNAHLATQSIERMSISSSQRSHESGQYAQENSRNSQAPQSSSQYLPIALRARVPRYCHHEMKYWFIVEAATEDGRYWELNREYTDFYTLQTALMSQFPEAAGKTEGSSRTLPTMPGPLPWVTERLTSDRRGHMDQYLQQLLRLPQYIVGSAPVRAFFTPREEDAETDGSSDLDGTGSSESEWVRLSKESSQLVGTPHDSRQSSVANLSSTGYTSPSKPVLQQQQSYNKQPGNNARSPPMMPQLSSMSSQGSGTLAPNATPSYSSGTSNTAIKIKVWFEDSNCVVIRLPGSFDYNDLVLKLKDRWSLEPGVDPNSVRDSDFVVEYKDDNSGNYMRMGNDQELRQAREGNDKLTLRVGVVTAM